MNPPDWFCSAVRMGNALFLWACFQMALGEYWEKKPHAAAAAASTAAAKSATIAASTTATSTTATTTATTAHKLSHAALILLEALAIGYLTSSLQASPAAFPTGFLPFYLAARTCGMGRRERLKVSLIGFAAAGSSSFGIRMAASLAGQGISNQNNVFQFVSWIAASDMLQFLLIQAVLRVRYKGRTNRRAEKRLLNLFQPFNLFLISASYLILGVSPASGFQQWFLSGLLAYLVLSGMYALHKLPSGSECGQAERMAFLEQQNREAASYCQRLHESQAELRRWKHDIGNRLLIIAGLVRKGETKKALSYLEQEKGRIESIQSVIRSESPSLELLLNAKGQTMKEWGIQFTYQSNMARLQMDEMDFCILLANALDNAIEACGRMESSSRKFIDLCIQNQGEMIAIQLANSCKEGEETGEGGTWKEDQENHGLGLKNMRELTKRYHGDLALTKQNGTAVLSVLLNAEGCSPAR